MRNESSIVLSSKRSRASLSSAISSVVVNLWTISGGPFGGPLWGIGDNSDMRTCMIINIVRVIVKLDVEGGLFIKGGRFERF